MLVNMKNYKFKTNIRWLNADHLCQWFQLYDDFSVLSIILSYIKESSIILILRLRGLRIVVTCYQLVTNILLYLWLSKRGTITRRRNASNAPLHRKRINSKDKQSYFKQARDAKTYFFSWSCNVSLPASFAHNFLLECMNL